MSPGEPYKARSQRHESFVEIRGVNYCLSEWGDRDAQLLVYLHGWGDVAATFQFVVDEFEYDWRIVAPDWRGFGKSQATVSGYWFPDYIADLHQLLHLLSPDAPVAIVGHSMGGNVAGLYAGTMPERVAAFVDVEGLGLPDSDPADAPAHYRKWIERSLAAEAFSTYRDFAALAQRIRKRNPRMTVEQAEFVARAWATQEEGGVKLRADPLHRLPNPVLYRRAEAEACWRAITAPTLLVCGSDSAFRHLPFPDVPAIEIDLAGHMLHFEAPRQLAHAIETFLYSTL